MDDLYKYIIMVIYITALSFAGGMYGSYLNSKFDPFNMLTKTVTDNDDFNSTNINEILIKCENNSRIDKRLECVGNHVQTFYKYKVRNDNENITFDVLIDEGGDCLNWFNFWKYVGEYYGYNVQSVLVDSGLSSRHIFAIISNYQGYCKIDGRNVYCGFYP